MQLLSRGLGLELKASWTPALYYALQELSLPLSHIPIHKWTLTCHRHLHSKFKDGHIGSEVPEHNRGDFIPKMAMRQGMALLATTYVAQNRSLGFHSKHSPQSHFPEPLNMEKHPINDPQGTDRRHHTYLHMAHVFHPCLYASLA